MSDKADQNPYTIRPGEAEDGPDAELRAVELELSKRWPENKLEPSLDRIEVRGVPAGQAARIRMALEPLSGSSLVSFDATDGNRRLASVPVVASASYDRDFPHTLVVTVVPEVPVALLRRGSDAWVVSDSGRVLRRVSTRPLPSLPRRLISRRDLICVRAFRLSHGWPVHVRQSRRGRACLM